MADVTKFYSFFFFKWEISFFSFFEFTLSASLPLYFFNLNLIFLFFLYSFVTKFHFVASDIGFHFRATSVGSLKTSEVNSVMMAVYGPNSLISQEDL